MAEREDTLAKQKISIDQSPASTNGKPLQENATPHMCLGQCANGTCLYATLTQHDMMEHASIKTGQGVSAYDHLKASADAPVVLWTNATPFTTTAECWGESCPNEVVLVWRDSTKNVYIRPKPIYDNVASELTQLPLFPTEQYKK